jgi:hypothetical protein
MKRFALAKAAAILALSVGLEAGFLLQAAVPSRDVLLAARARSAATRIAEAPPAAAPARAVDRSPMLAHRDPVPAPQR